MGALNFIFNLMKKKKRIVVNFNSDDLTDNEKLATIMNENAFLKGKEARRKAEESKKRDTKKDEIEEQEKIKYLNEQEKELKKKELNPLSLFSVLRYVQKSRKKPKKFKPINFTTFDGHKILGNVEDFVILPDGALGVVSDGKVIWGSKDINHVFFWIAGLNNFAKNKMIPLCVNSNNQFEPNVLTEEVGDLIRDTDGKFKINRFNRKPLYEFLAEKNDEIQELNGELEMTEATVSEQQKEISEKTREANVHKTRADKVESDLSMALSKVTELEMAHGNIARQTIALTQLKEINEDLIDSMEKVVKKWGEKIEDEMGGTRRDKEWEDLKSKLDWAKQNMPEKIYQLPEKEEKPGLTEGVRPVKV